MTNSSNQPRAGEGRQWLFGIVEVLLVLAALVFVVIALFLAPSDHESFAALPSARLTDFAMAAGLAVLAFALAVAADLMRRKHA